MSGEDIPSRNGRQLTSERQRVLMSIFVSAGRPMSTTEVCGLTGQTLGATAHHVRKLAADGYLDWAGERRVRGALQTFYVPSEAGEKAMEVPRFLALLEIAGLAGALPARPGECGPMRLPDDWDEEGLVELHEVLSDVRPRIMKIMAGVQARSQ